MNSLFNKLSNIVSNFSSQNLVFVTSQIPYLMLQVTQWSITIMGKNVLGYYRYLGSLRYGNEYCVEFWRCMGKNIFSSSTEAYFNQAVITARW